MDTVSVSSHSSDANSSQNAIDVSAEIRLQEAIDELQGNNGQ